MFKTGIHSEYKLSILVLSNKINSSKITNVLLQILFERGQLSPRTKQVLNTSLSSILKEQLAPELEFWSSNKTLTAFSERKYFQDGTPQSLKQFLSDCKLKIWLIIIIINFKVLKY